MLPINDQARQEETLDPELSICDPHIHIMDAYGFRYLLDDHINDAATGHRIASSVYVEAHVHYHTSGPEHLRSVGEVAYAAAIHRKTRNSAPHVAKGIVSFVDLAQGSSLAETLDEHVAAGGGALKGIRQDQAWDATGSLWTRDKEMGPAFYARDEFRAGLRRATQLGLSFDSWQYYYQLPALLALARACPETAIVVDHTGGIVGVGAYAGKRDEIFQSWRCHVRELADCPNVWIKLGGLGMEISALTPGSTVLASSQELASAWAPYIETCIEVYGAGRCMFASNFPMDRLTCTYHTLWNAFKRIASGASTEEKQLLFHGSAESFYRIAG